MAGLTLLETMFALALGIMVIIAIMLIYNGTKKSGVASKVISDVTAIVAGFDNYIGAGNPGGTPSTSNVQAAGFLAGSGGNILDPYGANYDITYSATDGTVTIAVTGLKYDTTTSSQCAQIGAMLGQTGSKSGGVVPLAKNNYCAFQMPL